MKTLTKIMLVEDDDSIRAIASRTLEKLGGFEVTACPSGVEALNQISKVAPQLVVMDVMMPGLSGIETLQKFKERDDTKNIPVIFSTARVQPMQVEEYKKMDVIGVISKPFDPITLSDTIKKIWMDHSQDNSYPPATPTPKKKDDAMASLFKAYAEAFPQKLEDILTNWDNIRSQKITTEDWHQLHFKVHQLAGSCGSFGFTEESALLREIENIIAPFRKVEAPQKDLEKIENLIASLKLKHDQSASLRASQKNHHG